MEDYTIVQICFIPVFLILSFGFGLLPIKIPSIRNNLKWSGTANAFAGGVFLAIALIHLLPEADELMNEGCGGSCGYPVAFLLVLAGYILILLIERVFFSAHKLHAHNGDHARTDSNVEL
jgi:zinc transporter 1/2/3